MKNIQETRLSLVADGWGWIPLEKVLETLRGYKARHTPIKKRE
jgi:hypothetical protein